MPSAGSIKAGFRVPCPYYPKSHGLDVWLSKRRRLFAFCRFHGVMVFLNGEQFKGMVRGEAKLKLRV